MLTLQLISVNYILSSLFLPLCLFDVPLVLLKYRSSILIIKLLFIIRIIKVLVITHDQLRLIIILILLELLSSDSLLECDRFRFLRQWLPYIFLLNTWRLVR